MNHVSFYGGEGTGSVAEKPIEAAKNETTGSVGYKKYFDKPINTNELERDTVCFRGRNYDKKSSSTATKVFGVATAAALAIAGMGYAHKVDAVSKLKPGKIQDALRKTDAITKPCHDWCHKIKEFCSKIINKFKK